MGGNGDLPDDLRADPGWRLVRLVALPLILVVRALLWVGQVLLAVLHDLAEALRRFWNDTPLGQARVLAVAVLLLGGALLLGVLAFPNLDRALVLTGRTEVLSMRLDDPAFGALGFGDAVLRPSLDAPALPRGSLQLDLVNDASVRFARIGRGALVLTFGAGVGTPGDAGCTPGLHRVGTARQADADIPLCEGATVLLPLSAGDDPVVVGLSGTLVVGEEVSQGAGPRPILLQATASLFVEHSGPVFRWACGFDALEHLCDRFVADSLTLAPGSSVQASGQGGASGGTAQDASLDGGGRSHSLGFLRADPNEVESGMMFNLAAPASAFQVTRIEGKPFTIKESLFDIIERSPLMRTLNVGLAAVGLLWYFLRLRRGGGGEEAGLVVAVCLLLGAAPPAGAQQAMLRANEEGQGLLRSRGDRCYAVTPDHVMRGETSALVTAPGRERGEGDLLRRIPAAPEAVALLTLRGIPLSLCPPFEGPSALDSLLRDSATASLRLVRPDGSIDRIPLLISAVEVETMEVRTEAGATLEQGMSGGTVLVADQPVGLLVDVLDGGRTGRAVRLDRVFERLAPHLSSAVAPSVVQAPTGSVAYEIVRSNAVPVAPGNKASSLQGEGTGPWRVAAEGRVELVLKVVAPTAGVALDLTGLDDPPATVEVLGSTRESGPWQSLAGMSLEPGDTVQVKRFPATRLPYLLLRAIAPAARNTLAIQRLTLLPR